MLFPSWQGLRKLSVLMSTLLASVVVMAGTPADSFKGVFVEGGVQVHPVRGEHHVIHETNLGYSSQANAALRLGYLYPIASNFLMGVSVGQTLGKQRLEEFSIREGYYGNYSKSQDSDSLKNKYQLAFIPAYAINDQWLLRGKLAYHKAALKGQSQFEDQWTDLKYFHNEQGNYYYSEYPVTKTQSDSVSFRTSGLGLGLGVNYKFHENMYAGVDVEQVRYRAVTCEGFSIKPSTMSVGAHVGYRF